MAHDFETLKPKILHYLEKKSPNGVSTCYLKKKIIWRIISADKYLTNDDIYYSLVKEEAIDTVKIPIGNFPKIIGQANRKLPFIGSKLNVRVKPYITEYYFKETYLDIKNEIRCFIENYRCP